METDNYKVLLVDDSPDDRFFERMILERNSKFNVIGEARDGQEAIDYLQKGGSAPDLMLLDLKMPRTNGFDVLQWMQTVNLGHLTVVVMSGSWLTEDINQSMALGAHGYFKKPGSRSEQEKLVIDLEKLLYSRKG